MTDEELKQWMHKTRQKIKNDKTLESGLKHGKGHTLEDLPDYETGTVLNAFGKVTADINTGEYENVYFAVLTGMMFWPVNEWRENAKPLMQEIHDRCDDDEREKFLRTIRRLDLLSMKDIDTMYGVEELFRRAAMLKVPLNAGAILVDLLHWDDEDRTVQRRWIDELVG